MGNGQTAVEQLQNGLTIVSVRRPASPVAGFFLFYRVGSASEGPGHTGLSHFLEHMCFKDSSQFPWSRYEAALYRRGAVLNAFTSRDTTCYWGVLPAEHLQTIVAVEAARMCNVQFDPEVTARERSIIVAEREGGECRPGYLLYEDMLQAAFGRHPYSHMIIGSKADIGAVTAADLARHYHTHYRPDNAVAVVVSPLGPAAAIEMVKYHFGPVAEAERLFSAPNVIPAPSISAQRRIIQHRVASVCEGGMIFTLPPSEHPDSLPLLMLASLLGGVGYGWSGQAGPVGRASRLYRGLVTTGLVTGIGLGYQGGRVAGSLVLDITAPPDADPAPIEKAVWQQINRVCTEKPADQELERARNLLGISYLHQRESALTLALSLGMNLIAHSDIEQGLTRYRRFLSDLETVTAADIQRVAAAYLQPEMAAVGWLHPVPAIKAGATAPANLLPAVGVASDYLPQAMQAPSQSRPGQWGDDFGPHLQMAGSSAQPPAIDARRIERRPLPGGTLLVYPMPEMPMVAAKAWIVGAGMGADPWGQAGLARAAAAMLTRGFGGCEPRGLEEQFEAAGMSLQGEVGLEGAGLRLRCLPKDLDVGLDLLAQALMAPDFLESELESVRRQMLSRIDRARYSTALMAAHGLSRLIYPAGHPWRRPSCGVAAAVSGLTPAVLRQFHRRHYQGGRLIVAVAGPINADAVSTRLGKAFAGRGGEAPAAAFEPVPVPPAACSTVAIPGKPQSDIAVGFLGVTREHPDWLGLRILATVLGPGLLSRLFKGIRETLGISYSQYTTFAATLAAPTVWSIRVACARRHAQAARMAIQRELELLATQPISPAELKAVNERMLSSQTVALETAGAVASQLLRLERLGLGLDYLDRYPDLLAAWHPQALLNVARRYLDPSGAVVVLAGPNESAVSSVG